MIPISEVDSGIIYSWVKFFIKEITPLLVEGDKTLLVMDDCPFQIDNKAL